MKALLILMAAALLPMGSGHPLVKTRNLIKAQHKSPEKVMFDNLVAWPGIECVVRYVDHERMALGLVRLDERQGRFVWYGWVPLDEQIIGRTVHVKDWARVMQRAQEMNMRRNNRVSKRREAIIE